MNMDTKSYIKDPDAPFTRHRVGAKITKGRKAGHRFTFVVDTQTRDGIYDYLWDAAMLYKRRKINFIIEWHKTVDLDK
jgi:hypothetical protein